MFQRLIYINRYITKFTGLYYQIFKALLVFLSNHIN